MIDVPALVVRDGIFIVAWLTAVYLVVMLLSLFQLSRQGGVRDSAASASEPPVSGAGRAAQPGTKTLRVSPRHEIAVSLAFQGFDVAGIARRCDISVAEAKLVAALAQSCQSLETIVEEQHGRPPGIRAAA